MIPRLTIRRMMLVVAIGAIPLWLGCREIVSRQAFSLSEAGYHERREKEERSNIATFEQAEREGKAHLFTPWAKRVVDVARRRAIYHAKLAEQYRIAARLPWKEVPQPIPPEPGENEILPRGDDHQLVEFKMPPELTSFRVTGGRGNVEKIRKQQNAKD